MNNIQNQQQAIQLRWAICANSCVAARGTHIIVDDHWLWLKSFVGAGRFLWCCGTPYTKALFATHFAHFHLLWFASPRAIWGKLDRQRQWPSYSCLLSHMHDAHKGFEAAGWWSILEVSETSKSEHFGKPCEKTTTKRSLRRFSGDNLWNCCWE